jgi:hypothetical protein
VGVSASSVGDVVGVAAVAVPDGVAAGVVAPGVVVPGVVAVGVVAVGVVAVGVVAVGVVAVRLGLGVEVGVSVAVADGVGLDEITELVGVGVLAVADGVVEGAVPPVKVMSRMPYDRPNPLSG